MNEKEVENENGDNHEVQNVKLVGEENVEKMDDMKNKGESSIHSESEKVEQHS